MVAPCLMRSNQNGPAVSMVSKGFGHAESAEFAEPAELAEQQRHSTLGPLHLDLLQMNEGEVLDLDDFDTLVFRVRGDGRKYLANLRTENWIVGDEESRDIWQAFLFARWARVGGREKDGGEGLGCEGVLGRPHLEEPSGLPDIVLSRVAVQEGGVAGGRDPLFTLPADLEGEGRGG
jgi:hypothetical protein